jgi:hypothetical protein
VAMSLGGSSLINGSRERELCEYKRLTDQVFAIIDSERDAEHQPLATSRQEFLEVCKRVGITCHVLDRRATENYLSEEAVKRAKGERHRELLRYEKLNEAGYQWSKAENWRIAQEMKLEDIDWTDLGQFLASL